MNITSKQDYDRELERLRDAMPRVPGRIYHPWGAIRAWNGPVDEYGRPYSALTVTTYTHSGSDRPFWMGGAK